MKRIFEAAVAAIGAFFGTVLQTFHNRIWARIRDVCQWILDLIFDMASDFVAFLVGMLPQSVRNLLNQNPFTGEGVVSDAMASINYFIPVYAMLGIIIGGIGVAGLIRFIRWVIACIPTVGAG